MNFVYFNPDEMRADVLGCYGHELAQTPNYDRLAEQGTRFDQCHVQHTVCSPSRCSFLTGWYPHTRGHRTLWHLLQPDEPNTFRYLKDEGYDVHWVGKNDALAPESVGPSVTKIHGVPWAGKSEDIYDFGEPGYYSFLRGPVEGRHRDEIIVDEAVDFIKNREAGAPPFMLFIASSMPHPSYTVAEPFYSMYDPDDLPSLRPAEMPGKPSFVQEIRKYRDLDRLDESTFRKIQAVYLGMVSFVDHLLGRILEALNESGLADETTVVAFSDHGDWAGDYGLVEKWPSGLDDCLTRIPMIIRAPDMPGGCEVNEPIESFDIVPTTLELAGIEEQHTHHARSLVPQLEGAPGDPDRAVFAEGGYDVHEPQCFEGDQNDGIIENEEGIYYPKALQQQEKPETVCRSTMLRTSDYKLIRRTNGEHELYDLNEDPCETKNVYGQEEYQGVVNRLEEQMLDWYIHTSDVVPFDQNPRGFSSEVVD